MLYLSRTVFVYRFYKILVNERTTEVKAESIGAPSVKEIVFSLTRVAIVAVLLIAPRPDPVGIKFKTNNSQIKEMFLKCKYKQ
jgi:hypothetical protein